MINPPLIRPPSRNGHKQSAVIRTETLNGMRSSFERVFGIILIIASAFGCVAATNGGVLHLFVAPAVGAILAGIGIQAGCTTIEWLYRPTPTSLPFLFAVGVDVATSLIGLGPFLAPFLIARFAGPIGTLAQPAAWLLLVVASVVLAWAPMAALID